MKFSLRLFLSYYRPYRRTLILDLLCALVVAGITLIYPLCAGYVTRTVLHGSSPEALPELMRVGAFMLVLLAVQIAANTYVDYQGHMMGTYIERDMRRDLFAHLQRLPFGFYDSHRTGQLMSRVTNDLYDVGELAHHGPEDLFIALLLFGGVFGVLLNLNPRLTLLLFCFLPFMAAYTVFFNMRLNRAMLQSRRRIGDVNAQVEDTLAGIRVVQSFTGEGTEQRRFDAENGRFVDSRRAGYHAEAYFYQGMVAFTQLMTVAVLVFGGLTILRGQLRLDELVTYLLCVGILMEPIRRFVNIARLLQEGVTGFQRFQELMAVQPDITDAPGALELKGVRGDVEFRQVRFQYPSSPVPVLRNINLTIAAGEFVALVGASGVGKSTLCALIPRFYEVTSGQLLVDGVPVDEVTLTSLRRNIGVVQQDVYLFSGTVLENILYGRPDASTGEVIEAARQAGAHDFIMALPQGYGTDIGQRGVKLSGGQKQRLSIARVFLKDPPILIFDEATSALDNDSERLVQQSLERLAQRRTTLVIAHRLSTVRNAGRIVVMTEDGISEQGTHDELMRRGGVYAELQAVGARL
ncbi:ABC transporter ATP-binding protein [Deinococcus metallilatus]|uniref:ABC transporter ATP-binding protein n=1 Tax=Deinococcus metallilatus TaxID=1211322 RepID=A0AAJ5K5R6_9DEIO|nr:ABC transporter ATP-binding protein [Deinococcus metallilatus]MBB5294787.1 ATP-binding cassette subfamily B protein [Deinococcus metallilatus]QBY09491.1 ABC transporter ATP-binding protein [Deinococcus metallilatus]RXJ09496.1 ABC transporter ATP-binding protein [Deinococcus metallilatus]TLK29018.1 ABC transporter ATP-binding protein [Deinococcus metallilatus]GMA16713.1 ABC transporter ATP-binding protein [Deinococcus metallilatus]